MATETHESTEAAGGHESAGLPQFDTQWWPGQIAWFLILFTIVILFMRFVAVPRVGGTIDARDGRISDEIGSARKMRDEAVTQAQAAAAEDAQGRAQAQKIALDARAKAKAEVVARLAEEEASLAAAAGEAEARIAAARNEAMAHVQDIAAGAAQAIVQKLTGRAATAAEVKAAQAARG
jgi:F-type H+-transporting ATPase subunit b